MEITTALATIKAFGELASLIKKSKRGIKSINYIRQYLNFQLLPKQKAPRGISSILK